MYENKAGMNNDNTRTRLLLCVTYAAWLLMSMQNYLSTMQDKGRWSNALHSNLPHSSISLIFYLMVIG